MSTRFYVDGFNLYYAAIKGKAMHWLDLQSLCDGLAECEVDKILYCTARVSSTPTDPEKANRQDAYIRALKSMPRVEILEGQYKTRRKQVSLKGCTCDPASLLWVKMREEKGTDVNLASHLIHDAHMGRFETAFMLSGDTDLAEAIRIVRHEIGKRVVVVNPARNRRCDKLKHKDDPSRDYMELFPSRIKQNQLPDEVLVKGGVARRPERWKKKMFDPERNPHLVGVCPGCNAELLLMRPGDSI